MSRTSFLIEGSIGKNEKFRDLAVRLAGPSNAIWALVRLWGFAALYRPDGDLTGIDPSEVPLSEIEWKCLIEARAPDSKWGFLEVSGPAVLLHDWPPASQRMGADDRRRVAGSIAGKASAAARRAAALHGFRVGMKAHHKTGGLEQHALLEPMPEPVNGEDSPFVSKTLEAWLDDGFSWFYSIYPKKRSKQQARKAWANLHRDFLVSRERKGITKDVRVAMAKYIAEQIELRRWETSQDRIQFIPDPSTFLNQRRWED